MLLHNPNDAVLQEISKGNLEGFKKATEEFLKLAHRRDEPSSQDDGSDQPASPQPDDHQTG